MSRYACVADQKAAGFPVTKACEVVEVSTSGFYDWCARETAKPTVREVAEAELVALIREVFDATGPAPDGSRHVGRAELRDNGIVVNVKRVRRLMRLNGMAGRCIRRRVRTTLPGPDGYTIPDLVGRAFTPGRPDWAWCQDITYIATGEGWLYLASVIDIGSRRMLGYAMADHMRTELVIDALDMAIATSSAPPSAAPEWRTPWRAATRGRDPNPSVRRWCTDEMEVDGDGGFQEVDRVDGGDGRPGVWSGIGRGPGARLRSVVPGGEHRGHRSAAAQLAAHQRHQGQRPG